VVHAASGGAMETDMRIIVATLTSFVAFAAMSAQAAPLPPIMGAGGDPGTCPPIEKVAQEHGSVRHNVPCNERWGYRHSDNCFSRGSANPCPDTAWPSGAGAGGGRQALLAVPGPSPRLTRRAVVEFGFLNR
jgi:hypothetical protein